MKYLNKLLITTVLGVFLNGCTSMNIGGPLMADEQRTISIFRRNNPAVVCISTEEQIPAFRGAAAAEVPTGAGTGFVWDRDGHIVTTQHMVTGHKTVKVRLTDQRVLDAEVLGSDAEHDIAVLKLLEGEGLPNPVQLGSSRGLQVGQRVFTIGNAFDLGHSFTTGIISALGRSFEDGEDGDIRGLIQTDAAINPGSSGAPLLDSSGRVIGMNVAIYSLFGGSEGIGFAIPVDTLKQVVPGLVNGRTAQSSGV